MLLDARNSDEVPDQMQAHVVIVGAGTVGLFLAMRLIQASVQVVLIESGGRVADTCNSAQTAVALGKSQNGLALGRAFGLGGTSTLWGGQLAEFDRFDLTARGREWPIDYSELRAWYEEVYLFFGINAHEPVASHRRKFGNEAESDFDVERFFTYWLPQPNFAALFRSDILSNPSLKVVLNATANDISFDGPRATKLRVQASDGRKFEIGGERFVFASGTVETSRFFLTTRRKSCVPWKDNDHVGAYFQDHLGGRVAGVRVLNERKFRDFFENCFVSGIKLQPKLRFAPMARGAATSGVCGFFNFQSKLGDNIANLKLLVRAFGSGVAFSALKTMPRDFWAVGGALAPLVVRYARDQRVLAFFDRGLELHVQAEQIPTAESAIRLMDEEPRSDGLFRAAVNWKIDGGEIASVREFALRAGDYLHRNGIAELEIDTRLLEGDGSIMEQFSDTYHQCGGMCMGASASAGVVDPNCRVWGSSNVYVAGASVFPTSSHANCTLTALALATRLASALAGR